VREGLTNLQKSLQMLKKSSWHDGCICPSAEGLMTRMNDRWNDMSIGERIVLSAWMAVREHLAGEEGVNAQRSTFNVQRPEGEPTMERCTLNVERWAFDADRANYVEDDHYREGAD